MNTYNGDVIQFVFNVVLTFIGCEMSINDIMKDETILTTDFEFYSNFL